MYAAKKFFIYGLFILTPLSINTAKNYFEKKSASNYLILNRFILSKYIY
jgi:hypothetical protein